MVSCQFYLGTSRYAMEQGSYNLSLPRSLYGDDINGNTSNMMMTQSMDPAHLAARLDNNATPSVLRSQQELHPQDIMTASLDPSLLAGYEPLQVQYKIFFPNDLLLMEKSKNKNI